MERTQKSRFLGVYSVYTVLSHGKLLIYTFSFKIYINVANQNVHSALLLQWDMKLNLDNIQQDTYKTQKSKTKLQTKGRKIQKETKGLGFKDTVKIWGLLNKLADQVRVSGPRLLKWKNLSASPWDMGENQNLTRKHLQTVFK